MKVLHVFVEYESFEEDIITDLKVLLKKASVCGATEDIFESILAQLEGK